VFVDHLDGAAGHDDPMGVDGREAHHVAHPVRPESAAGRHEEGVPDVRLNLLDGEPAWGRVVKIVHPDELVEDSVVEVNQHGGIVDAILEGEEAFRRSVGLDEVEVRFSNGFGEEVAIRAEGYASGYKNLQ